MEKKYFSIKEVTKMLDLPASTLRFWEKEIDAFNPNKSAGGTRRYVQKDIDVLKQIKYLIEEQHLTLAGVNERLSTRMQEDEKRVKIIETLQSVRNELMDIRLELNGLEAFEKEFLLVDDGEGGTREEHFE